MSTFHSAFIQPTVPLYTSNSGGLLPNFEKLEQPLDFIQEAATAVGLTAGQDVFIGIDCAAHEIFDHVRRNIYVSYQYSSNIEIRK